MVRAYLISFVAQQRASLGREACLKKYGHAWLVWEPGSWRSAKASMEGTIAPEMMAAAKPNQGQALCFALTGMPEAQTELCVGRADTCSIVINDATVSREHLQLSLEQGDWWMVVNSSNGAKCEGTRVPRDTRLQLRNGMQIRIGDVRLTYYDAEGFLGRLETEGVKKP